MAAPQEKVLELLSRVNDPEIPVLNVVEMGIVREVSEDEKGLNVAITPTYSGCPAMEVIEREIRETLEREGMGPVSVRKVFAPAWTTDWLTGEAKRKLREYGIAPPGPSCGSALLEDEAPTPCPFCRSGETELRSRFGSTACKALYYCRGCQQPFEKFKCI